MYKLIIEDDEGHTTVVPLVKDEISIGRKEGNIIRLTERNVSRHHARLIRANGSVFIEDLDSYNGVKVNGGKISAKTTVREGDLVEIGDYHLALQKADQPPPTPGQSKPDPAQPASPSGEQKAAQPMAPTTGDGGTAVLRLPLEDKKPSDPGRARAIPEEKTGHLVTISTDLNGQNFSLDKTEITIGRTEENDICLPHRSVSSKHAKIVFDGGVFRVIDLDSANGVLVNGEEYARVDIRRGDVIELGHVKLKYVAPGEDINSILSQVPVSPLVESPAAPRQMVDASISEINPRGGKGKLIGIVAGFAVVIGIVVVVAMNFSSTDSTQKNPSALGTNASVADNSKTKPIEPAGTKKTEAADYFKQGLERMKAGDWVQAENVFSSAIKLDPEHKGAQEMLERVQKEQQAETLLQRVNGAIQRKDWDEAVDLINQIPEATKAAKTASTKKGEIVKKYRSFHLNRADRFEKNNLLKDAIKELDAVLIVDPKNYLAQTKREKLTSRIKKAKSSSKLANKNNKHKNTASNSSRKEAYKKAKKEANAALKADNYSKAISLYKKALKYRPKDPILHLRLGISWAMKGNTKKAYESYVKFVKICPNCPQTPKIRNYIKDYEAQQ